MVCATCGKPFVGHYGESTTLVGYEDVGEGHDHDDNCLKRTYVCADGHFTYFSLRRRCLKEGCGWVGKAVCFCHPEGKVDAWPEAPYIPREQR